VGVLPEDPVLDANVSFSLHREEGGESSSLSLQRSFVEALLGG